MHRLQGLNTGVVLYRLERMRQSLLYSTYLHPEAVSDVMERLLSWLCQKVENISRYNLEMSLAEQDWFTALRWQSHLTISHLFFSFAQPSLIGHLPCKWNTQGSLEVSFKSTLRTIKP